MQVSTGEILMFLVLGVSLLHQSSSIPATVRPSNTTVRRTTPVIHPTKLTKLVRTASVTATTRRTRVLPSALNLTVNATVPLKPITLNTSSVLKASSTKGHTIKVREAQTEDLSASPVPALVGRRVAFSVAKATERLHAFAHVHFRDVLTNVGGGWDPATSEFVTPYDGKYFFTFHAIGANDSDFTMSLTRNRMPEVTAYGTTTTFEHGSNSIVLDLKTMDKISLELHQGAIYENPGNESYTSFTGFLISSV
ncbi:complement C1q-like protein 2 [Procambarus clarkii]|uniref:complement C1q-like protein 2 n=1 Tax=Procambarus clarkii TaxID=6728 RepID=UPI003742208C